MIKKVTQKAHCWLLRKLAMGKPVIMNVVIHRPAGFDGHLVDLGQRGHAWGNIATSYAPKEGALIVPCGEVKR